MFRRFILLILLFSLLTPEVSAQDSIWRAGVAKVNITPELPIWLSGYGGRNRPATEILDDLWAKALVLEDSSGKRAVLVTMDIVGIDRELSTGVCRRIEEKFKLPRAAVALCSSHTHSGPVIRGNLVPMFNLDEDQTNRVKQYKVQLADKLVEVVGNAVKSLASSQLSWTIGTTDFAVNRRTNPEGQVPKRRAENTLAGPVDHDLPVLAVHDAAGKLRAIVAGYACHATVLDTYKISADWPGAGQNELERRHPGTIALFWAGCGADQNPLPRRSVELMNKYGVNFADGVDRALNSRLHPISPTLHMAYDEVDLAFNKLPTRAELEVEATAERPRGPWATFLLEQWDQNGGLSQTYSYPVQSWKLGSELTWLFLGGEVVVDYSLRLKSELGAKDLWVASYANDVMGYIPSRRVLNEGGYEGGLARYPYGLPAVWGPKVEEQVIEAVHKVNGK
jgi:hypothetical protein